MFRSESSISSEWEFTGVSKAGLLSTTWTAATPHRTLPVVSDFDLLAATILSYHNIVAAHSAVGRSPSPVRWPGMCAAWRPPRPVAQCRQFQEDAKDASVSECIWTLSALEALRNALYKFKTYLLTYLLTYLCPRSESQTMICLIVSTLAHWQSVTANCLNYIRRTMPRSHGWLTIEHDALNRTRNWN